LLHRLVTDDATHDASDDRARALRAASQAREKLKDIQSLFQGFSSEVQGGQFWRYQKNVSPGLQEYIEALSFAHFLETGKLITFDQVQQSLCDNAGVPFFPLPVEDYLLGLSDLTGELMRYAISAISRRGGRGTANDVCAFVRSCKGEFERFIPYSRDLRKKQFVTSQSLEKIEDAAYAVVVRCSEYDLPPDMLDDIVARTVSNTYGGDGGRRTKFRDDEYDDREYEY